MSFKKAPAHRSHMGIRTRCSALDARRNEQLSAQQAKPEEGHKSSLNYLFSIA
ncbi:hypothetical protein XHC_3453 [Xanthomonas hortorum pv. carotae str. M081]|nr:hypothetical protein XHC_3453 [Xanthomonas hortorum pv. carotae str. M081]